ncbi:MAG: RNA-binding protein [Lentisphaeraceae bacterium]|nr:RNA-binding protein [Lentisphaeraceae bacterium]
MKILVRNLDRETGEKQLQALFEAHGKVESCKIVLDGESGLSKGFAFVNMPKPHEAKTAIKALNGKELDGYKIRVKKATPKKADDSAEKK